MKPAAIFIIVLLAAAWGPACVGFGFYLARQGAPTVSGMTCEYKFPAVAIQEDGDV